MDARPALHPSARDLAAFGQGKLDDAAAEQVIRHLDGCADCRQAVAAQSADDFLDRLRAAHGLSGTPLPEKSLTALPPRPAAASASQVPVPNLSPELARHPQYEVLKELGRGGMGVVYLARHRLSGRREVLKVMNKELLRRPGSKERFLREIQSAALLDHPYVVKMYTALEVGELMVLVMEFVEGVDLDRLVKGGGPLPVATACLYAHQVALGLQHAADKGMAHRDVKPQNLILTHDGDRPVVKVLDFGLAKVKSEKGADADLTGEGKMLGTPHYVAPEQITDAAHADARADVYSLGCTLYYLLSGAPPFARRSSLFEILQAHRGDAPQPLNRTRPEVPAELAAVVGRMMEKDAARRYQTPVETARALAPFLRAGPGAPPKPPPAPPEPPPGEPTTPPVTQATSPPARAELTKGAAAPPPARQGAAARKWLLGAGVAAGVLLLGLLALWAGGVFRLKTPEGILVIDVNVPSPDVYVDGAKMTVTWGEDGKKAEIRVKPGTRKVEVKKDGFKVFGEEVELQDGKRRLLTARLVSQAPSEQAKKGDKPSSPASGDGSAAAYDLTGGFRFVHFGPGGSWVVLLFNSGEQKQHFARVYDLATGKAVTPPLRHDYDVEHAAFSPDGRRVVTASSDCTARVWDAATGEALTPPLKHDSRVEHAAFSPDGRRVVTASLDETARVWETGTGQPLSPPLKHSAGVNHAAFSPDGKRVVTASWDNSARVWDAATGHALTPPLKHAARVEHAAFSPDGTRVVTASRDWTARVWDAATGQPLSPPFQHSSWVYHAAFSPDGQRVVTAGFSVRMWDAATGQPLGRPFPRSKAVRSAAFSSDGRRVVTGSTGKTNKTATVWDAATGKALGPPLQHDDGVKHAAFSPDGKQVVTTTFKAAWLWDAETGKELKKVTVAPK